MPVASELTTYLVDSHNYSKFENFIDKQRGVEKSSNSYNLILIKPAGEAPQVAFLAT